MEIPKRKFALEERDLAIEADENNKIAEEKEYAEVKKRHFANLDTVGAAVFNRTKSGC